jgi:hypothetical protein
MRKNLEKAQASLEMAITIIAVLIFFLGCIRLFFWVNERLVLRQERYEATRASASEATSVAGAVVSESGLPKVKLVGP